MRTWGWLGFASLSLVFVHYNGLFLCGALFLALLYYERGSMSWAKGLAFAGGCLALTIVYLCVNILPAWSTVRSW